MTNYQSMHTADCCGCGPKHYEYEVWQDGVLQAGGRENDYDSAKSEANHYAMMYANDGPVEVRIYEKRLLSTDQIQPKRRRYDPSGSLSEYGIFPECDAQPLAEEGERDWLAEAMDTLAEWRFNALFGGKDGLQAEIDKLRKEVEELRSFAEAQVELRDEAEDHAEDLAKSLAELITWIPSADTYRRLGFDPEAPMRALKRAKLSIGSIGGLSNEQRR